MSVETRHTEKSMLFQLLKIRSGHGDVNEVIAHITAVMEPMDVELVEKRFNEWMGSVSPTGTNNPD